MARILALNVYDLQVAQADVAAGRAPDQLVYGLDYFTRNGHSVEVVPYRTSRLLTRASELLRRTPLRLGDLDQERSALRRIHDADVLYCPNQGVAELVALLRAARLVSRPIVCLLHHPIDCGRLRRVRRPLTRALLRGLDAYPALTEPVARDAAALAADAGAASTLPFGPDPTWYPTAHGVGRGVIAAGRSGRDFATFSQALGQTRVPGWIVCPESLAPRRTDNPHVRTITYAAGGGLALSELLPLYSEARAIAIPLRVGWPFTTNGLASLADALGMGKPVIMTRSPWLDLDIERLGIGLWVEPGDVAGWRRAIEHLDDQPQLAEEMGRRARALVDDGRYSSRAFAEGMMSVFERVLAH